MAKNGFKPSSNDFIIVVMGPTGSGKSNFINTLTGNTEQLKASNLRSDTQDVTPYPVMDNGNRVVVVDTPGFDHTYRPDSEILRVIADWLTQKYPDGDTLNVAGIIYLHRITDNRMSGSLYKNLQVFGRLCGNVPLHRARLVTTMWDKVKDKNIAESRERELIGEFWQQLIHEGAIHRRFVNTNKCAWDIIHELTDMGRDGDRLLLQEELVEQNKHLNETEAAKVLYSRFQQLLITQKRTLKELVDEANMQNNPTLAKSLQEEYNKINVQLQKTFCEEEYDEVNGGLKMTVDEMNEMKFPFFGRLTSQLFGSKSRVRAIGGASTEP